MWSAAAEADPRTARPSATGRRLRQEGEVIGPLDVADERFGSAIDDIHAARAELSDMGERAAVAAEAMGQIATLIQGPQGETLGDIAEHILNACLLADAVGHRLARFNLAMEQANRSLEALAQILGDMGSHGQIDLVVGDSLDFASSHPPVDLYTEDELDQVLSI